jgi:molecular chaperone DnaJ
MQDYYDVLGIPKNASQDEVKKAYRKKALELHPDRNKDKVTEEKFKEVNEAYAVLGDPEKRSKYDAYGPEAFNQQYSEEDIFRGFNPNDIFRDLFGAQGFENFSNFGFGNSSFSGGGNSVLYRMNISLRDAADGVEKEISLRHVAKCDRCNGEGAEPGSKIVKCSECRGTGRVRRTSNTIFGSMQVVTTCPECSGTGRTFEKRCRVCLGKGGYVRVEKIKVKIPAGVRDGMRLRLEGMGDYSRQGSGDLYIEIGVQEDRQFVREGDDIHAEVNVPFYTALLGGGIEVPTLKGSKAITLNRGTQQGARITLKNEGMRRFGSNSRGDEIITVNVEIPKSITSDEEELMKRFKDIHESAGKKKFGLF